MKRAIGLWILFTGSACAAHTMDLSGTWQFGRTRETLGRQTIHLPGSMQEQDLGDPLSVKTTWTGGIVDSSWFNHPRYEPYRQPGNIRVPFWLQSETHYVGEAWYQREVVIPDSWRDQRIVLHLERPHWETMVWVDGREIGMQNSLSTPHEHDLGAIGPGAHILTIRVDNRIKEIRVGPNSHSVSDHTQSNWNGVAGKIWLSASASCWIDDVQVYPVLARNAVRVAVRVGGHAEGELTLSVSQQARSIKLNGQAEHDVLLTFDKPLPVWDEFHPVLHAVTVRTRGDRGDDQRTVSFGMREVGTEGTRITINGKPTFLRGTLECAIFPMTGYPATDVGEWRRIIRQCKAHGLNHMRFHSWCPPEAAFAAADELGFYLQVECASWANQGAGIGDGEPLDAWLYEEGARILKAYGNHPSFIMMAYGNEPAGSNQHRWLGEWVNHWKAKDPRRIYTSGAGWPAIPENQYHNLPQPRIQGWGQGLGSRINARAPETMTDYRDFVATHPVPVVSHEIGQWCVYPDFDEIAEYTGVLKPKNFEIFRDFLNRAGMADQAREFLMASGKLQALCYKEEIESALRTPGFGGFQLLDLHDFPGQGTALVGVLDPFWNSKPYLSPEAFARFCGPVVPLARMDKRVWTRDESFRAGVEIAHFGPKPLGGAVIEWALQNETGHLLGSGLWTQDLEMGELNRIGAIEQPLRDADCPARISLRVSIQGTSIENAWSGWVYAPPAEPSQAPDGLVVSELNDEALARLNAGDTLWLMAGPRRIRTDVRLGFSSIFWNTAWTQGQAPHTLGILCNPLHPALADFPSEYHSNWQWWDLVSKAATMELDALPRDVRPIVQVVPDWFNPKKLGLAFQARVGRGKLLVTSMDLKTDLASRPVANQMRASLLAYIQSNRFEPETRVSAEQVRALFKPLSRLQQLGATISADSAQAGHEAEKAMDGDPETLWHTPWGDREDPYPHFLEIDLGEEQELTGISVLPRRDLTNGRIAKFSVEVDGRPVANGSWIGDAGRKEVSFQKSVSGRRVKLIAESETRGRNWASVAEYEVNVK